MSPASSVTARRAFVLTASLACTAALADVGCGGSDGKAAVAPSSGDGSAPSGGGADPSSGCARASAAGVSEDAVSIDVGGTARTYSLVVPAGEPPKGAWPVVLAFHGSGGTGSGLRKSIGLEALMGATAILAYPDAVNGSWDIDTASDGNRDLVFFDALVAELSRSYCVDSTRVFATGFSNGAYFANHLAYRRGDAIRAVAPQAGGGPYAGEYGADGELVVDGRVAAMVIHGAVDRSVTLSEGKKSLAYWQRANGCEAKGASPAETSPCVQFAGCDKPVLFCEVPSLGHKIWDGAPGAVASFFASF